MTIFLTILLVLAMLATLGVLGMGVVQMIRGGDPRRSNKLMQSRVAFQGLALLLLALLMMLIGDLSCRAVPMVRLTRIYTRGGDRGQTSLGDGSRVAKQSLRVEAFGTVDEANAAIGLARLHTGGDPEADAMLARIQNDLFDLGADLCTPEDGNRAAGRCASSRRRLSASKARSTR